MRLSSQKIRHHAKDQTRTRSHSLPITVSILAAYVVCGFVEQVDLEKDIEPRRRAVKAIMIEAAMPNATAAVYSKAVVHFISEIVRRNGPPIRDRSLPFWTNWHGCLTIGALKDIAAGEINETIRSNANSSISDLFN